MDAAHLHCLYVPGIILNSEPNPAYAFKPAVSRRTSGLAKWEQPGPEACGKSLQHAIPAAALL